MLLQFKKILFVFTFNISLFLILMLGIQNSSNSKKVNLIQSQTVNLPISFIIGISFITGNLTGSILNSFFDKKTQ